MCFRGFLRGVGNINPGFGRDCVEEAYGGFGGVRMEDGDGPIDRNWRGSEVFKNVGVV
jgi:hypothetical protein